MPVKQYCTTSSPPGNIQGSLVLVWRPKSAVLVLFSVCLGLKVYGLSLGPELCGVGLEYYGLGLGLETLVLFTSGPCDAVTWPMTHKRKEVRCSFVTATSWKMSVKMVFHFLLVSFLTFYLHFSSICLLHFVINENENNILPTKSQLLH